MLKCSWRCDKMYITIFLLDFVYRIFVLKPRRCGNGFYFLCRCSDKKKSLHCLTETLVERDSTFNI
jgi:hypothetical protein